MAALVPRSLVFRSVLLALALFAAGTVLASVARAAPGDLDPTFGAGGSERLFTNPENLFLGAVATQPDGKIVMAGADEAGVMLVRLLENGGFDPSFGTGGIVTTGDLPGTFPGPDAVGVQPDGKIVIAGSTQVAGNEEFLVARFLTDGQLDPSFGGGDGSVVFPVGAEDDEAFALALGAGGRILVTGVAETPGSNQAVAVAVLQPNGERDPGFSADGVTTVESPVEDDEGEGIAEAPGGDIVIADESGAGAGDGFTIVKLLPSGIPDPGFGTLGIVQTPIPGSTAGRSTSVAVLPDGRIVAAGYGYDEPAPSQLDSKFAAARYLANGELDPSFGAGTGIISRQLGPGDDSARFVALTPSGKAVLVGDYEPPGNYDSPAVLRLTASGTLDATFGNAGIVKRPVLAPFGDYYEAAALDARERLVLLSNAYEGNNTVSVEVTRILGDVPPEPPSSPSAPTVGTPPPPPPPNRPPHARIKRMAKALAAIKLKGFSGTAADPDGEPVRKVQIALVRKVPPKAHASAAATKKSAGKTCLDLRNAKGGFSLVHAKQSRPCPLRWLDAKGTAKWSFKLTGTLPVGGYVLYARAIDSKGFAEPTFSTAAGNQIAFRVTAK